MIAKQVYALTKMLPKEAEAELEIYTPLMRQLLWNRGITSSEEAVVFLNPNYERDLHDPFLLTGMEIAVSRVIEAIKSNERIAIYSDYDCDGIPGGVVLHDFFHMIGFQNFENYIPHRHDEGFGFNTEAVVKLGKNNVSLIITIDCGTTDHAAVDIASKNNIDVIITDHHEIKDSLPNAYAFVNPKQDASYPFPELCGTGVIYKLVQALIAKGVESQAFALKKGQEKWLLDMVGIATIADMVPLRGENRALAYYGLTVLRKSRRPGLHSLLRKARASQQHLTEDDVGFTIGPRINAASRMDTPEDAFGMLATKDEAEAKTYVDHLEKLNTERKGVVATMTKEIKKRIALMNELPPVIVMGNPEWKPSLVGLTANSLVDTYKRPVFLWGRDGKGVIKGSCRSDGYVSTIHIMNEAKDSFIEYGGHHGAGGFAVDSKKIYTLQETLMCAFEVVREKDNDNPSNIIIDADLTLAQIDTSFITMLSSLAPFGEGNKKPLFRFVEITPSSIEVFGKTKNHTKLIFDTSGRRMEAIAFFKTPDMFEVVPVADTSLTLIAHVEQSFFMGRQQTRLRIVDIV